MLRRLRSSILDILSNKFKESLHSLHGVFLIYTLVIISSSHLSYSDFQTLVFSPIIFATGRQKLMNNLLYIGFFNFSNLHPKTFSFTSLRLKLCKRTYAKHFFLMISPFAHNLLQRLFNEQWSSKFLSLYNKEPLQIMYVTK